MTPHPSPLAPYKRDASPMDKDPRVGLQKGIQYYLNSCYLDAAFMILFYHHSRFDEVFTAAARHEFSPAIRDIVESLRRSSRFCPAEKTTELRKALKSVFGSCVCGDFMDIDVFLQKFFGAMKFSPFIEYGAGTKNYSHSIFLNIPQGQRLLPEHCCVQSILGLSLQFQSLKFKAPPSPALLIKMPYSNGVLMGMDYIVPSLELRIQITNDAGDFELEYMLAGIACLQANHYTAFLRDFEQYSPEWLHSNSKSGIQISEVVRCGDLEQELQQVQRDPARARQLFRMSSVLEFVCSTMIYCIYVPKEMSRVKGVIEVVRTHESRVAKPPPMPVSSPTPPLERRHLESYSELLKSRSSHQALAKSKENFGWTVSTSWAIPRPMGNVMDTPVHQHSGSSTAVVSTPTRTKTPVEEWLESEWDHIQINPPWMGNAAPNSPSNLFEWTAFIQGPKNSPYEGGTFQVSLTFSRSTSRKPPTCRFITPIFHLNFSNESNFNIRELSPESEDSMTVEQVIFAIYKLMEKPNLCKPLGKRLKYMYNWNFESFCKNAVQVTRLHAMPGPTSPTRDKGALSFIKC